MELKEKNDESHALTEAKTKLAKLIKQHGTKLEIIAVAAIVFELGVLAAQPAALGKMRY